MTQWPRVYSTNKRDDQMKRPMCTSKVGFDPTNLWYVTQ